MSRPHPTGRRKADTPSREDHIDATDLLDDEGNIDLSAVRSRVLETHDRRENVTPAECARWRRQAAGAESIEASDIETEFAHPTVADHVSGACAHAHDEPALTYNGIGHTGEWHRPGDSDE